MRTLQRTSRRLEDWVIVWRLRKAWRRNVVEQEKKLQFFLIKKFIITLLAVSLVEYVILWCVNHLIIPWVLHEFFPEYNSPEFFNGTTVVLLVFLVIAAFIVGFIEIIIPEQLRRPISLLSGMLQRTSANTITSAGGEDIFSTLNGVQRFILFVILLGVFLLIVTPYVLGAIYYTRITVKEFEKIAEARVAARKDFERKRNLMLSDIAHDLRTPITTVAGYSKALSDGMVAEDRKQEYLDAIQAKSVRMNDLIGLLFDYVKLDSEGFSLNKQEIDICELVRECGAMQYSDAEEAGMEIVADIPEDRMILSADKIQLSRVITNLITNAVKHNNRGDQIGLFVEQQDDRILIMVADTGRRIPDEKAEHLFDPFAMGDESRNSKGGSAWLYNKADSAAGYNEIQTGIKICENVSYHNFVGGMREKGDRERLISLSSFFVSQNII